jgi:hypothetical protein
LESQSCSWRERDFGDNGMANDFTFDEADMSS